MIIFYYGKEVFGQERNVQALKKKFLAKNSTGGGFLQFDCSEDVTLGEIHGSFGALNLFAQKKLIVIKDFFQHFDSEDQKALKEALSHRVGEDVVVLTESSVPRKNATLFTWLLKNAQSVQEFTFPDVKTSSAYIVRQVKLRGSTILPQTANLLAEICGEDLFRRENEIEKLCSYAFGKEISKGDIALLCNHPIEGNMFAAIESLTRGRSAQTMTLLHRQVRAGDDVHYVFSMYAYQIRTLLRVGGYYYEQQISDKSVIAKALKLHPFVVEKSLGVLRQLTQQRLRGAHKRLLHIDRDVKVGKRDMFSALEMFIMEF